MSILGLIAILFTLSVILIMVDRNNKEMNLVPVRVKNAANIEERLAKADIDELKKLGMM